MKRTKLLAANWKMNLGRQDVAPYFAKFLDKYVDKPGTELLFAVPFLLLEKTYSSVTQHNFRIAAQNVHFEEHGAFTGEISWTMLSEIGVNESLIGHSERRQFFGETDDTIAKKIGKAKQLKKRSVLCVGENLADRNAGLTFQVIIKQLQVNLSLIADLKDIVIAYEPVWAIGTGLSATAAQAQEVHAMIRRELSNKFGSDEAEKTPIVYGGSMNMKNTSEICSQPDIDGGLVGGASLKPEEFSEMHRILSNI